MYKSPYKHKFLAGSSKCSIKPLSILFTKLLTHIKQGLQKYIVLQNSLLEKWDQSDVDPFFFFFFFFLIIYSDFMPNNSLHPGPRHNDNTIIDSIQVTYT